MHAYSLDLRERVVADREALGTAAVAAKYRVSPAWVRRLISATGDGATPPSSAPSIGCRA